MKFNPKSLKSLFEAIRKSPIDDIAVNAAKSNVDDLALGALDVVDDIPQTHLLSSAIPFPEGTPDNPVDVDTFKDVISYADGIVPYADRVNGVYGWRPHKNTALGKWFNKNKRMPNGISDEGLLPLDDPWAKPDDRYCFRAWRGKL